MADVDFKLSKAQATEAVSELSTIRDFIRWTVSLFNQAGLTFGHGTDNSWDEAVHLVLAGLHLPPDTDAGVLDATLVTREKNALIDLIEQRVTKRLPLPYLTQEAWFGGLSFYVDERVHIPRSPIFEIIEKEFYPWISLDEVSSVLDLCTGSGSLAVSLAIAMPHAEVEAVDISSDALDVAAINVERYDLEEQITLTQSNLFDKLKGKQYDIIVSNPPYVSAETYHDLPKEYSYEPEQALLAGKDGLDAVKRILEEADRYLTPNGILVVEVGYLQPFVEEAFPAYPFTWPPIENGGEGVFILTAGELKEAHGR